MHMPVLLVLAVGALSGIVGTLTTSKLVTMFGRPALPTLDLPAFVRPSRRKKAQAGGLRAFPNHDDDTAPDDAA